jgi:ATP-dependent helicase YprA (DUF1998 family)
MNIFDYRNRLIRDYSEYVESFIRIRDARISDYVKRTLETGFLWPEPLIQVNPSFEPGKWIDELVQEGVLHEECRRVFRKDKHSGQGNPLRTHAHQEDAIRVARGGHNYVLTTGTGSGKSLAYIVPIVDQVLRRGPGLGIQAIIVYPMNALANSQYGELEKFLSLGYPDGKGPVTFARYTGQESDEKRQQIIGSPPDILLTNYVMLELILTRPYEKGLIRAAQGLRFLVLDELHTYRGRQGADVAMLIRRVRNLLSAHNLQCIGTSATLASSGSFDKQRTEVATVASSFFGDTIRTEHVIGETLQRTTPLADLFSPSFVAELRKRVENPQQKPPLDFQSFVNDPLSSWIESTLGITAEKDTGRMVRAKPKSITSEDGAASDLSKLTGVPIERCAQAIQEGLLAGYHSEPNPETGFPVFAFRLHQYISRGDTVYASVESEADRYITLDGQQYVPNDRNRVLLPIVFCRECGQEYYCVRATRDSDSGLKLFSPRELNDRFSDEDNEAGFLYLSTESPWPTDLGTAQNRLPDDWLEERNGKVRIRSDRMEHLPQPINLTTDGKEKQDGLECAFFPAPFRFCLHCGVSYGFRQQLDFAKLSPLGSEGRSTATTILSLAAIRGLRDADLPKRAQKLLSFTDNRQDASLQAGHFNDFIEIGILRAALYRAAKDAGTDGLQHDTLAQKVFDALSLPFEQYAQDSTWKYQAKLDAEKALKDVLGYRLYYDLRRGWRITLPNLEQCGLLEISYTSLEEVCRDQEIWHGCHQALATASPEIRARVAKVLLDYMRRELAIKVDYLDTDHQERTKQRSNQRLISPWAIDENEADSMEHASLLFPRSRKEGDYGGHVFLSARGGFGQFLRRNSTFPDFRSGLTLQEAQQIAIQLLDALRVAGIVAQVAEPRGEDDVPGYQLVAGSLVWKAGDGTRAFHDPIRVPNESALGSQTNAFFVEYYRSTALKTKGIQAREHTAQVQNDVRIQREDAFRKGDLPVLYCSPTMELGIDIAELNVVNLRNVPPTPANYAQRSGRAGRSGQPALVFSYCAIGSSHDQYFFKRPQLMVAGQVSPPRIDPTNEDLVRAHIHAIWLTETDQALGSTLCDILDVSSDNPTLNLLPEVVQSINSPQARERARARAKSILESIEPQLRDTDWYSEGWLDEVLNQAALNFDKTCERWRGLYRSALKQAVTQDRIIRDATRSPEDRNQADRLRREAESQLKLLTEPGNVMQSDFYPYRYFASEGFLPGYNFPRLPLSAYIPGRRQSHGRDEFLSRPRFLSISEFGPRAIVYHEGSKYIINKVILPVGDDELTTKRAKQCATCGYLHPITDGEGVDLCEHCREPLGTPLQPLFKLQNVVTKRRDKINADEEERLRLGYEIRTGIRFAERGGRLSCRTASVTHNQSDLAKLTYGHAATVWRINLGWSRREKKDQYGFMLDTERGYWERNKQAEDAKEEDPLSPKKQRVIPYVEDRRNCLLFAPSHVLTEQEMASLQAALKSAIQVRYQLEDSELAAEPLPEFHNRRLLLFYEAAEGGAGVLRRLLDDPQGLASVAREALRICHFDPDTGNDLRRAPHAREDCEAACYNCLMSYSNQPDHEKLDRKAIRDFLMKLAGSEVKVAPVEIPRADHLQRLLNQCSTELERDWLRFLETHHCRLPSKAQHFVEGCQTRPDFLYDGEYQAAIYVDGPIHDFPHRKARDQTQVECMEDHGYTVIRFGHKDDWAKIVAQYPYVFGKQS